MFRKTLLTSLLALSVLCACVTGALAQVDQKAPARDPKTGKFMKAGGGKLAPAVERAEAPKPTVKIEAKKVLARDAKGRFVKPGAEKVAPTAGKMAPRKMMVRDAKGRFVKAGASTMPPAPKAPALPKK
jgi:hypothetical protein